jgi:hypothetical protein
MGAGNGDGTEEQEEECAGEASGNGRANPVAAGDAVETAARGEGGTADASYVPLAGSQEAGARKSYIDPETSFATGAISPNGSERRPSGEAANTLPASPANHDVPEDYADEHELKWLAALRDTAHESFACHMEPERMWPARCSWRGAQWERHIDYLGEAAPQSGQQVAADRHDSVDGAMATDGNCPRSVLAPVEDLRDDPAMMPGRLLAALGRHRTEAQQQTAVVLGVYWRPGWVGWVGSAVIPA